MTERKIRKPGILTGERKWEYEIGESQAMRSIQNEEIMVSFMQPVFMRQDTKDAFQWRIRNLPYPLDVYDCKVNENQREITLRTSNKKYVGKQQKEVSHNYQTCHI